MNELVYKNRVSGFLTAFEPVKINALPSMTFTPHNGFVYTKTLSAGDTFTFNTPEEAICTCELWLVQGASAVSFTWGSSIWWADGDGNFALANPAPTMNENGATYCLVFRFDGTRWLGSLAYKVA